MATYREINGGSIQNRATNPSNVKTGEVWYNEDTGKLRYGKFAEGSPTSASWATGGNLNTDRGMIAGTGTQTSALAIGSDELTKVVEAYNGSSWTEIAETNNVARSSASTSGTSTSALNFTGYLGPGTVAESWNGSSWTDVAETNTPRYQGGGLGANNTSALAFGGYPPTTNTESWNGSSWTEVNNLNSGRYDVSGAGENTAGLAIGGFNTGITETWNGTSWTEVADLNTPRGAVGRGGTQTSAIAAGGRLPSGPLEAANTELWNGSSWTETADLSVAGRSVGGCGATNAAALAMGRLPSSASTEEFTGASVNPDSITATSVETS